MAIVIVIVSFIVTWYVMQHVYTPTYSETPSILQMYEDQGCVRNPDFVPSALVIWDGNIKYVPFDDDWHTYKIVYFCP